jgi:uncharacterized protein YceK
MHRLLVAGLIPTFLSGCGTLCTAFDDQCEKLEPYSGVRAAWGGHATQLDVPFSFVADTVILPITVPKWLIENASDKPEPQPPLKASE